VPQYRHVFKDVTGQIRLSPNVLFASGYEQIEIDLNSLVLHGRELIPSAWQVKSPRRQKRLSNRRGETSGRAQAKLKTQRGPAPGTTGFASQDRKLFPKMQKKIDNGEARSPHSAAMQLIGEIAGGGSPESKAKRVSARYRKRMVFGKLAETF